MLDVWAGTITSEPDRRGPQNQRGETDDHAPADALSSVTGVTVQPDERITV